MTAEVEAAVADAFHAEWGRVVATLVQLTGDWDLAEERAQNAFATALERWPRDGIRRPAHHGGPQPRHRPGRDRRALRPAVRDGPIGGDSAQPRRGRVPVRGARGPIPPDGLRDYYLLPAARGDMLRRLDRRSEAAEAYRKAHDLAGTDAERHSIERRRREVSA